MSMKMRALFFCGIFSFSLFAEKIETFYGEIEVEEPILLELIHSPGFQRLKKIHQYGIAYYTTHREEYNRYDHSVGVFTILRLKGASLKEQIAGLLHDASHTAFSHVGDFVFQSCFTGDDYQTFIHKEHLIKTGIGHILNAYGYTIDEILPTLSSFTMLEQPLPNLNADRIDYNIQGAYFQQFLTKEEALELFSDLAFQGEKWISTRPDLIEKIAYFSLFMTENCWGSVENYLISQSFSEAIRRGVEIGAISWDTFHFGHDDEIWETLKASHDPLIKERMFALSHVKPQYVLTSPEEANLCIPFKCRGINPWILEHGTLKPLSQINPEFAHSLETLKEQSKMGWTVKRAPFGSP